MTLRVDVSPEVLAWAAAQSGSNLDDLHTKFPRWEEWMSGDREPTVPQLEDVAQKTGVPFGYLLLREPPRIALPIPDFREGYGRAAVAPSSDLMAVLNLSIRRQDWYRDYATDNALPVVEVVGSASQMSPHEAAADMRARLNFEVAQRRGSWGETRKHLLLAFEGLGGLTVATSMVENNSHRMLDPNEFRGFALVDRQAPLLFVNTNQTLNGQIFTIAHELAHIWRGTSGISIEDPRRVPQSEVERWCDAAASEFLVPATDLAERYGSLANLELTEKLERLARDYKCGTLVVLQAIRRGGLHHFDDFDGVYETELQRLLALNAGAPESGGSFYNNQPYRIGRRFSLAIIRDALEGRTPLSEAIKLTSLKSLSNFDKYANHIEAQ